MIDRISIGASPMSKAAPLKENFADLLASEEACWRAVLRRDARLDGLLYYGVASTRIYCRPVCRARRPKVENVAFFRSCDDAEKAGYRPCKLCRPTRAARPMVQDRFSVRPAAVLFADIRGYSRIAARLRPDETFALLDEFHARLRAIIEAHAGVVHKHLGDGFMAIFGAAESTPSDAHRALASALALTDAMEEWKDERQRHDETPIAIGIGLHYGMAAFGPSGGEQAIIGDTVNVASRLERLTRRLDTALAVSDETLRAISTSDGDALRARLREVGAVRLPGCGPRRVWVAASPLAGM
jgi:class 3 adenylate cyclase